MVHSTWCSFTATPEPSPFCRQRPRCCENTRVFDTQTNTTKTQKNAVLRLTWVEWFYKVIRKIQKRGNSSTLRWSTTWVGPAHHCSADFGFSFTNLCKPSSFSLVDQKLFRSVQWGLLCLLLRAFFCLFVFFVVLFAVFMLWCQLRDMCNILILFYLELCAWMRYQMCILECCMH